MKGIYEKHPGTGIWWVRYSDGTRIRREKVGRKSAAIKLYAKRKTEVSERKKLPENFRSVVRVKDLVSALRLSAKKKKLRDLDHIERRLDKHLIPHFGELVADDVGTDAIDGYVKKRIEAGAQHATINRELALLKRMFRLGHQSKPCKVDIVPTISRLVENDARSGFVEQAQYEKLKASTDELWLKAMLATAYTFAFRRGELLNMKVAQIDLNRQSIQLEASSTKSKEPRLVIMTQEVYEFISACVAGKNSDDYVFTRGTERVKDFRAAWWDLCVKAGLGKFTDKNKHGKNTGYEGQLFHDLRRSGVRNLVRVGVSEKVAMTISGHKTRDVFDRYNIVSELDLRDAAKLLEKRTDTKTSTSKKVVAIRKQKIA
jgi:integrase